MFVDRCLKLSVRDEIKRLLELGTGDLASYNIYGEEQFRGMDDGSFTPTAPYCFLVMSRMEPTSEVHTPFMALDFRPIRRASFELGNRNGREGTVWLHVLGQTDGEGTDLADYIKDGLPGSFALTNQNEGTYRGYASGATMAKIELMSEPVVEPTSTLVAQYIHQATTFHWYTVSFDYRAGI